MLTSLVKKFRTVFGSAILLTIANIITNLAVLLFGLYLARQLSNAQYGQYAYMVNVYQLLYLFLGFGLTNQAAKDVAEHFALASANLSQKLAGLIALRLLSCVLVTLGGIGVGLVTDNNTYSYAGVCAAFYMYNDFAIGALSGLQRYKSVASLIILQPLAYLGLSLLFPINNVTVIYNIFLASQLLSGIVATALFLLPPVLRIVPRFWAIRQMRWRQMVAGQAYIVVLLQTTYGTYGVTIFGLLGQYSSAGEVSIALTVVRLLPLFATSLVTNLYYPRLCVMYSRSDQRGLTAAASRVYQLGTLLAAGVSALLLVYGDIAISFIYTQKHAAAIPLLQMLAIVSFFSVADLIITWTLLATGYSWQALVPLLVRMLLLVLTLPVALVLHLSGPQLTNLVVLGYIVASLVGWLLQLRYFKLTDRRTSLGFVGLMLSLVVGLGLFLRFIVPWSEILATPYVSAASSGPPLLSPIGSSVPEGCTGSFVGKRQITLECSPGYVTARDRILVYSSVDLDITKNWKTQLNYNSATWIFEGGLINRARLIIAFSQQGQQLVARLFDDQDGDGEVAFQVEEGRPLISESRGRATMTVEARDSWWLPSGKPNFNLDMVVDGPVSGTNQDKALYLDRVKVDSVPNLIVHVRDSNGDGRPDYEWRQVYAPLPEGSQYYRTLLMVNPAGDEPPLKSGLFWPFLGTGATNYIKLDYGSLTSPPPVNVDWTRGKLDYLVESVASRQSPHNYFAYSIKRIIEGQTNDLNFESPFAFYQLSPGSKAFPDLSIRTVYYPSGELNPQLPVEQVDYSWRQSATNPGNVPNWDYHLNLLGRNPHQGITSLPDFNLRITPYAELPNWVARNSWDYATFVAREQVSYPSSERIYEWSTLEGVMSDYTRQAQDLDFIFKSAEAQKRYVTGLEDKIPAQYFQKIRKGLRGELRGNEVGPPMLYLSAVDHKLHLLGAMQGVWNFDDQAEIRYQSLKGDGYLDQWTYTAPNLSRQLNLADGYLLYSDGTQLVLRQASVTPSLFETLPPGTPDGWKTLGQKLEAAPANFAPDDLRAMLNQFAGPEMQLSGVKLRDYRPAGRKGFRFVLELQPGFKVQGQALFDLSNFKPGEYVVTFGEAGFKVEALTPPALSASITAADLTQLERSNLQVQLRNEGLKDVGPSTLEIWATFPLGGPSLVATQTVNLKSREPLTANLSWTPPRTGKWTLVPQLRQADGQIISLSETTLQVSPAKTVAPGQVVLVSSPLAVLFFVMLVLGVLAVIAGIVSFKVWHISAEEASDVIS